MKRVQDVILGLRDIHGVFIDLDDERADRGHEGAVRLWSPDTDSLDENSLSGLNEEDDGGEGESAEGLLSLPADIDREALEAGLGGPVGSEIRRAVEVRGIEALAWYVPFHARGPQWGIYISTSGLVVAMLDMYRSLKTDIDTLVRLAFRSLHRHELFHFATEYGEAQMELVSGQAIYRPRRDKRPQSPGYDVMEEALANAYMIRSIRHLRKSSMHAPGKTDKLLSYVRRMPEGYCDGDEWSKRVDFERGCGLLMSQHLEPAFGASGRFAHIDHLGLFPFRPHVDWRYCPIHILNDASRMNAPEIYLDLFSRIETLGESAKFQKKLQRASARIRSSWSRTKRKLCESTALQALDFKSWSRTQTVDTYSVRLIDGYRAHLRYDRATKRWTAEDFGSHKAMGHG